MNMERDRAQLFEDRYSSAGSHAARLVEQEALGHSVGVGGYTTVAQAEVLLEALTLHRDSCVVDVGAGRGWPGRHILSGSDCRLVSTDIPWEGLRDLHLEIESEVIDRHHVAAADGGALPFRTATIDAIVHADAFC